MKNALSTSSLRYVGALTLGVAASLLAATAVVAPSSMAAPQGKVVPPGPVTGKIVPPPPSKPGSSCSHGKLVFAVSEDKQVFTLMYADYSLALEDRAKANSIAKECAASIVVNGQAGYQFAIGKVDQRGYIKLSNGVKGKVGTAVSVDDPKPPFLINHTFTGPLDEDFTLTKEVVADKEVWSPCGQATTLRVNSAIEVSRASAPASGFLHMDSTDVTTGTALGVGWRRC